MIPQQIFFDTYQNRGTASKKQEMLIAASEEQIAAAHGNGGHGRWGHDFKMLTDPFGNNTGFEKELKRFTTDQKKVWLDTYIPKNDAMKAQKLEGEALALWKFNRYLKDYLRTIQSVDDGVGELLDYLDRERLTENTIVVYTSDQGFYLGEHGWFDKRFMYEESLRTPLLMRYPKEIKEGVKIDQMIQNLDFAPTFLDYAGINPSKDMQGESFREIVSQNVSEWRDAIYYTYYEYPSVHMVKRHYGVRTERFKLIHFYYDIDEWELYDLDKDPSEMNNVYNHKDYKEIQQNLHKKLSELRTQYGDSDSLDQMHIDRYVSKMRK